MSSGYLDIMTTDGDGLQVVRVDDEAACGTYVLVRDGVALPPVDRFLQFLADRNMSPNTQRAYAYDLRHFLRFLAAEGCEWADFRTQLAPDLLHYLRHVGVRSFTRDRCCSA
jgi:integrase/recombinase XerD